MKLLCPRQFEHIYIASRWVKTETRHCIVVRSISSLARPQNWRIGRPTSIWPSQARAFSIDRLVTSSFHVKSHSVGEWSLIRLNDWKNDLKHWWPFGLSICLENSVIFLVHLNLIDLTFWIEVVKWDFYIFLREQNLN